MKVLFVVSEARPFCASGGLADVAGSLPKALKKQGADCRVVLPMYQDIPAELRSTFRYRTCFTVELSWRRQYCGVFEAKQDGVTFYFIDNEYYFKRGGLYGFYDDAERFAFFSMAALRMLREIDFAPDIIHTHDWHTALVPVYLGEIFCGEAHTQNARTVLTIHNIQYQGKYGYELLGDVLGLPESAMALLDYDGCLNLLKGGVESADRVTTVSPTYAEEILNPWHSHGLDRFLRQRGDKLTGILNGIDTMDYDPETDPALSQPFSAENSEGKAANKRTLQRMLGLPEWDGPLIGMVTRLTAHKGLDLIREAIDDILDTAQLVMLGSGDYLYESFFYDTQQRRPDRLRSVIGFLPDMARRIYAGCDLFLMPSQSEPCGLAQMIALRYGTLPIVRETGGLRDTIRDIGCEGGGNGFTFQNYAAWDMTHAVHRAAEAFYEREAFLELSRRAMREDHGWGQSARRYMALYREMTAPSTEQ